MRRATALIEWTPAAEAPDQAVFVADGPAAGSQRGFVQGELGPQRVPFDQESYGPPARLEPLVGILYKTLAFLERQADFLQHT